MSKPCEIAMVLPSLAMGGAERVMSILAREFVRRGLKVDMLLAKADGELLGELPEDVQVVELGGGSMRKALVPLVRYMRANRHKVFLSTLYHCNIIVLIAKRMIRESPPVIVREASVISAATRMEVFPKRLLFCPMIRHFYRYADYVVVNSPIARKELLTLIPVRPEKIKLIYNPIVNSFLLEKARDIPQHSWFKIREHPIILSVGRLSAEKNFDLLLKGVKLLKERWNIHPKVVILGGGSLFDDLWRLGCSLGLEKDLWMPGMVDNPYPYMHYCDVFVFCSQYEGLPSALIEAAALGANIVTTDFVGGGARIITGGGKWGRMVSKADPQALGEAIVEALREPKRVPLEHLKRLFGTQEVVDQYLRLIHSVQR